MSYPTVFANLAGGNQPASLLDTMFTIGGEQGNIPCTAVGTNAITLTPNTNFFLPTAYVNKQMVTWRAVATSSGAVTIQIAALGLVKLFNANGVQANSGDIAIGTEITCVFSSALDSGNGGFIIVNGTVTATSNPVIGSYNNKLIQNNSGTPDTQIDVTVGELVVENTLGGTVRTTGLSSTVTINLAVTGANGLDSGTIAAAKVYFLYGIFSSTSGTAAIASLSPTTPTLPAVYAYKSLLGAFITSTGSATLMRQKQRDDHWWLSITTGTNTLTPFPLAVGATGTYSTTEPTWATPSVASVLPYNGNTPLVSEINIYVTPNYKGAATTNIQVAPNNGFGGFANTSGRVSYFDTSANANVAIWMPVETTGIAAAGGAGSFVGLLGWRFAKF